MSLQLNQSVPKKDSHAPSVSVETGWLRVRFDGGAHGDFHLRWLRHQDEADLHPTTRERTVCSSDLPDRLAVVDARIDAHELVVTWQHDHRTSRYALGFLKSHAYALGRKSVPPPPSDVGQLDIPAGAHVGGHIIDALLARVRERGAAILRRDVIARSPESETELLIEALRQAGLELVETHFGAIEDLRVDNTTNANTDQLGYTDAPVDLHTDQPFLDEPPRYQMLQSIRQADEGGVSYVADALAAARYLESIDREAFTHLTTTKVRFHRKQKAFERVVVAPILSFGPAGEFMVRSSYFTMAPHQVPFDQMEGFYRAHDRFARLVRDAKHQYRFLLRPGDLLFYDNHRMLHARTAFRGSRWVRGVYFNPVRAEGPG